jgi:hypothetical protein
VKGRGARLACWTVAVTACLSACHKDPVVTDRIVTLHVPEGCRPGLPPLDATAFAVYHALGDYEPAPPVGGHLAGAGIELPEIDPAARALVVDTSEQDRTWQGLVAMPSSGAVDVLLLPSTTSCALRGSIGARTEPTLGATGGQAIGGQEVLIVGGQGNPQPGTWVLRLDTGALQPVPATRDLLKTRTLATVTPFGDGALVAGGIDAQGAGTLGEAEIYDPNVGGFDRQDPPITLSTQRASAGAAVLVTGETLLVGGVGVDGTSALDSMEIVDPATRTAHVEGVARLAVARASPTVLRLASGEILIAGGTDGGGAPVPTLEWFASDASHPTRPTQDLAAGSARTYFALESGGALAVIAPPVGAPAGFQNTWVIGADGAIEPATPIEGALSQPVLLGGAGGAPLLWTGAGSDGTPGRWLQWQPWGGDFDALDVLDDAPANVGTVTTSPDPGLAMWLDMTDPTAPRLTGLRFDVRGPYATLAGPLLVDDTTDVAPDRFAQMGVASFDPMAGLSLAAGASAFVTDRTYVNVEIAVDAPTGQPAMVVLRDPLGDELEVGGTSCPGALVTGAPSTVTVDRRGATVTWNVTGGPSGTCPPSGFAADARLSIGVRGAAGQTSSVARNLRVTRVGNP